MIDISVLKCLPMRKCGNAIELDSETEAMDKCVQSVESFSGS